MIYGVAKQKGFTIVELLIVIVVIGVLASITIVAFGTVTSRSKISRANAEMSSLLKGMQSYKSATGELPPVGDAWNYDTNPPSCGTLVNVENAMKAAGVANSIGKQDPWGNCWGYDDNDCSSGSASGAVTYLKSAGPDKLMNTSDDIVLQVSVNNGC